jgi:hypothetical protein
MAKPLIYVGPKLVPGTQLHSYGRYINPDIWSPEEIEKWLAIEPRYKAFFEEADAVKVDASKGK